MKNATTSQQEILSKLNEQQLKSIKALVSLGDSLDLAIKTIVNKKAVNTEMYRRAYE